MRLSVWVNDELAETIKDRLPGVNVSKVLSDGLRGLLKCQHDDVVCSGCGGVVDKRRLVDDALSALYRQAMMEIGDLVHAGGSCEGAARVLKAVAVAHQVSAAKRVGLPRPPRGRRERREWDRRWLEEQQRLDV